MSIEAGYTRPDELSAAMCFTVIAIVTFVTVTLVMLGWELGLSLKAAGLV